MGHDYDSYVDEEVLDLTNEIEELCVSGILPDNEDDSALEWFIS